MRQRLRERSPAPVRRLRQSAICPATSAPRSVRERLLSLVPRVSSRSTPCMLERPTENAGTMPNASPVNSASSIVTASVAESSESFA